MRRFLAIIPVLILLTGCTTIVKTEGNRIDKSRLANLKPGETTRQMIFEYFGTPTSIENENNEEKMVYVFREKKVPALGNLVENELRATESVSTLELVLRDNVVYSYRFKSSEN